MDFRLIPQILWTDWFFLLLGKQSVFPLERVYKEEWERKAMEFTRGGEEQELPPHLAESACPCSHQHSGAAANAVGAEFQEVTGSPSTHWSKAGKINVLVGLASIRLKKSSHRKCLIKQMEKEKHTSSFLNKTKTHFTNYWMSLLCSDSTVWERC